MNDNNFRVRNLFESELYTIDRIEEDGEVEFAINFFGTFTLHLDLDEWQELLEAMHSIEPEA
jgi:hypothetical protein